MPAPGAPNVKGGDVSGPNHAQQKDDQRRPVAFRAQGGHGGQGESRIQQAEDRHRGFRHHLVDRDMKSAIDQQAQSQDAEDSRGLVGIFIGSGKKRQNGHQHRNARRVGSNLPSQAEELPSGQHRHPRRNRSNQPERPRKHQGQRQGNQ